MYQRILNRCLHKMSPTSAHCCPVNNTQGTKTSNFLSTWLSVRRASDVHAEVRGNSLGSQRRANTPSSFFCLFAKKLGGGGCTSISLLWHSHWERCALLSSSQSVRLRVNVTHFVCWPAGEEVLAESGVFSTVGETGWPAIPVTEVPDWWMPGSSRCSPLCNDALRLRPTWIMSTLSPICSPCMLSLILPLTAARSWMLTVEEVQFFFN